MAGTNHVLQFYYGRTIPRFNLQRAFPRSVPKNNILSLRGKKKISFHGVVCKFKKCTRQTNGFKVKAALDSASPEDAPEDPSLLASQPANTFMTAIVGFVKNINSFLPQVVIGSTLLAMFYPPSFTWFTTKYYAPALGFLMFAVGINLSLSDFKHAFQNPGAIALGYFGQFAVKPCLGFMLATLLVPFLGLPPSIGSGLILCASVSGAQLSNYATFLVEPQMAPLSIVMTALSTATSVFVTPVLTLLLLGQSLPVDVVGMVSSIAEIVVVPIAVGLMLNRFAAPVSKAIKPALPVLSVFTTALCIGSPLASNVHAVKSYFGLKVLFPVVLLHSLAFGIGYFMSSLAFKGHQSLARTISIETGMQSSLLSLALANQFFADPLVGIPSAISVISMSLMGFGLVMYWNQRAHPEFVTSRFK